MVGILTAERGQIVFHDTPGLHRPLHRLNRQMVQLAVDAMNQADVVCLLHDASQPFGKGDAYARDLVAGARGAKVAVLNKIDAIKKPALLPRIAEYARSGAFAEIVPVSGATGDGCDELLEVLWRLLPEGEPLYDPELLTLHPERFLAAERIREKVLQETESELPFVTAVVLERWEEDERPNGNLTRIHAAVLVERPGQKAIVVGRQGQKIKTIGTAARLDLEEFLGRRVFLDLHVRVEPGWRENPRLLAELERGVYA
jgi:GTP-binding protein Era